MEIASEEAAFPKLSDSEMAQVRKVARRRELGDGDIVFKAGDREIDFNVVESGVIRILNSSDHDSVIVEHNERHFAGDIDMLTGRPVIVTAVAAGPAVVLSVPNRDFRHLLATIPRLGEKLLMAFSARRVLLQQVGILGMKVIGPKFHPATTVIREFLYKNFVPYNYFDSDTEAGERELAALNMQDADLPVIECGQDDVRSDPPLVELAKCVGLRHECPQRVFDLAVVGAGPAGMTAAVYAASEALSTIVLDRLGPGGQVGGSSLIENFIGFPSGLSGMELATRGVLQMLKFGATLNTPVRVERMEVGDAYHTLITNTNEEVKAKVVLAATGVRWRKLEAKGAQRFERAGVFYAATSVESRSCSGQPVAVIGGGNSAGQAAMFLSDCSRKVHLLIRGSDLAKGMSDYLVDRINQCDKIEVHLMSEVAEVFGDDEHITAIDLAEGADRNSRRLEVSALFVFIGAEPETTWMPSGVARDDKGYILVGGDAGASGEWKLKRAPHALETTVPRLICGGDLRAGSTKRVGFAVGDGSLAVTCVHRLLAELR